jgi:hypothetical protein
VAASSASASASGKLQQSLDEMMTDTMRMDGELSSVLEQMRKLAGE